MCFGTFADRQVAAAQDTAQDTNQQSQPVRTFSGRTFEEWRHISLYDLDHETRALSFRAMSSFRDYRDNDEILQAIVNAIDAGASTQEGVSWLLRITEDEAAVPYLVRYLQSEDESLRQNAVWGLSRINRPIPAAGERRRYAKILPQEDVLKRIIDLALHDDSEFVRAEACGALGVFAQYADWKINKQTGEYERTLPEGEPGELAKRLMKILAQATQDSSPEVASVAYQALWKQGVNAKPYLPLLIARLEQLKDSHETFRQRDDDERRETTQRELAMQNRLRASYYRASSEERDAIRVLTEMGPDAKNALPVLETMLNYRETFLGGRTPVSGPVLDAINAIKGVSDDQSGNK